MADNNQKLDEGFEEVKLDEGFQDTSSLDEGFEETPLNIPYSESFKRGAEQGASFGLYDELAGVTEAGGQAIGLKGLGGPISDVTTQSPQIGNWQALLDAYRSRRDTERGATKQAEEANPKMSFAGNMVGGIALPLGVMGNAGKSAKLSERLIAAGKTGAVAGAAAGAGTSEADLTKPSLENAGEFAQDVGTSTVIGGGLGPLVEGGITGVKALGKGLAYPAKKIKDYVGDIPAIQNVIETYKQHRAGNKVVGSDAYKKIGDEAMQVADDVNTQLFDEGSKIAKKQTKILESSNESIDVLDTLNKLKEETNVISEIGEYRKSDKIAIPKISSDIKSKYQLNEEQKKVYSNINQQIKDIENFVNQQQQMTDKHTKLVQNKIDLLNGKKEKLLKNLEKQNALPAGQQPVELDNINQSITQLQMSLQQPIEEINPQILLNLQRLHQAKQQLESQTQENLKNIKPSQAKDIVNAFRSMSGSNNSNNMALAPELKSPEGQMVITNAAKDLQQQMYTKIPEYDAVNKQIQAYNDPLKEIGLGSVNQSFQDPVEIGAAKSKLLNIIKGEAKNSEGSIKSRDALKKIQEAVEPVNPELSGKIQTKVKDVSNRLDLAKSSIGGGGASSSVLNLAGRAQGGAALVGDSVRDLNAATPEAIKQVAAKIAQMGSTGAELSRVLLKAADAGTRTKQAMIFSIMQNPSYRQLLNGGSEDERSK